MSNVTAQDVINDSVERRIETLEKVSGETLLMVNKQAVIVGLIAKVMLSGAGAIGLSILFAILRLVFKVPLHGG